MWRVWSSTRVTNAGLLVYASSEEMGVNSELAGGGDNSGDSKSAPEASAAWVVASCVSRMPLDDGGAVSATTLEACEVGLDAASLSSTVSGLEMAVT